MEVWEHAIVLRTRMTIFHIHTFLRTASAMGRRKAGHRTRLCVQSHTADGTKEGSEQDQHFIVQQVDLEVAELRLDDHLAWAKRSVCEHRKWSASHTELMSHVPAGAFSAFLPPPIDVGHASSSYNVCQNTWKTL